MRLVDKLGEVVGGRDVAEKLRIEVVRRVEAGEQVSIDLAGVLTVSPSFADEFFGKMPAEVGEKIEFENVSEHLDFVAAMARAGRPNNGD